MNGLSATCVALILAAMGAGCGDDDRPPGDGGTIMFIDGGPRRDGSTPGRDGGGGDCPPMTVPAPPGEACEAGTLTCLTGCGMDAMCQEDCITADADPMGCYGCLLGEGFACATMTRGCDDEWGNLRCCGAANCPTGSPDTCLDMECGPEVMAAFSCLQMSGCGNTMLCFM